MTGWIAVYVIGCVAAILLLNSVVNRGAHQRQPDPVVIREFAYRMRKVRHALMVSLVTMGVVFLAGVLLAMFTSPVVLIATLFSLATVALIVIVVAAPVVNNNFVCPACGEPPTIGEGVRLTRIRECEVCGVALE